MGVFVGRIEDVVAAATGWTEHTATKMLKKRGRRGWRSPFVASFGLCFEFFSLATPFSPTTATIVLVREKNSGEATLLLLLLLFFLLSPLQWVNRVVLVGWKEAPHMFSGFFSIFHLFEKLQEMLEDFPPVALPFLNYLFLLLLLFTRMFFLKVERMSL